MIPIYIEIAEAIKSAGVMRWIDFAPRVEDKTNIYPAAYVDIDEVAPLNPMGGSTIADLTFTVEMWFKPYHSATVEPLSPALAALAASMSAADAVRKAIFNLEGDWVRNTTLLTEVPERTGDEYYKIVQRWQATTAYDMEEGPMLDNPPPPAFETSMSDVIK